MIKERSLFANSAWGVISNILRALISFVFMPIVLYRIGAVGYGLYSILMLFTFYQGFLGRIDLGYSSFLIKHLSQFVGEASTKEFEKQTSGFLPIMFFIQILLVIGVFASQDFWLSLFQVPVLQSEDFVFSVGIVFIANFFSMGSGLYIAYLTGQHRNVFLRKTDTFFFFLFNILAIGFLSVYPLVQSLAIAFLLSQVLNFINLAYACRPLRFSRLLFSRIRLQRYQENWIYWRPFFYSNLNGLAFRQTDTALISFILGPQSVAAYDICLKIPSFVKSSVGRLSEVLVPFSSAQSLRGNDEAISKLLGKTVLLSVAVSTVMLAGVLLFGDRILFMWLGDSFTYLHRGFLIACLVPFFASMCSAPAAIFLGRNNRLELMTWGPTIISVINVAISIPLTLYLGFEGTILGTVIQYIIYTLMLLKPLKQDFNISLRPMLKTWVFTGIVFLIIYGCFYPLKNYDFSRFQWFVIFIVMNLPAGLIFYRFNRSQIKDLRALMAVKASKIN